MKAFLVLLILVGIAIYFYLQRNPVIPSEVAKTPVTVNTPTPSPTATPNQQNFDHLTALLNQDLTALPALLDAPAQTPANALAIRRKLGSNEATRPEYKALAQACDLILQTDSQRRSLQQACHTEQTRASFGSKLNGNSSMDHAVSTLAKANDPAAMQAKAQEIHSKYEQSWNNYRTQTIGQVKDLLATLAGKPL